MAILPGSTWAYRYETAAPPADWASRTFDDTAWTTGVAPLGWSNDAQVATALSPTGQSALVIYFRHKMDVANANAVSSLQLTTRADDGIVVYVNGTEVNRTNIPTGPVRHGTYANAAPSTNTATATPVVIDVPVGLLVSGENTIAAEVHMNWSATPSATFDLRADVVESDLPQGSMYVGASRVIGAYLGGAPVHTHAPPLAT